MRWTPTLLIVLGILMLALAVLDTGFMVMEGYASAHRADAAGLLRKNMSTEQLNAAFETTDATWFLRAIEQRAGTVSAINCLACMGLGPAFIIWGILERRARIIAEEKRRHPITGTACSMCGYDRTGTDRSLPCPECGGSPGAA